MFILKCVANNEIATVTVLFLDYAQPLRGGTIARALAMARRFSHSVSLMWKPSQSGCFSAARSKANIQQTVWGRIRHVIIAKKEVTQPSRSWQRRSLAQSAFSLVASWMNIHVEPSPSSLEISPVPDQLKLPGMLQTSNIAMESGTFRKRAVSVAPDIGCPESSGVTYDFNVEICCNHRIFAC